MAQRDPDTVLFYGTTPQRHTAASEFDLSRVETVPNVPIVVDYAGFDGSTIIEWVEKGVAGIVVQTFAGGRMSAGALQSVRDDDCDCAQWESLIEPLEGWSVGVRARPRADPNT